MQANNPEPQNYWPQQSPIALFHSESFYVTFPKGYLTWDYNGAPFSGTFVGDEGHKNFVLSELAAKQKPPTIKLGEVTARLVKIHLHTKSEHDLEGKDMDGELHLIHEIVHPTAGSTLLVLGVYFDQREQPQKCDLFRQWATQASDDQGGSCPEIMIDPRPLLPTGKKWYRYEGSLTTPPYTENVSWLVFCKPIGISSAELKKLKEEAHQPERQPQALNRRIVLRNFR